MSKMRTPSAGGSSSSSSSSSASSSASASASAAASASASASASTSASASFLSSASSVGNCGCSSSSSSSLPAASRSDGARSEGTRSGDAKSEGIRSDGSKSDDKRTSSSSGWLVFASSSSSSCSLTVLSEPVANSSSSPSRSLVSAVTPSCLFSRSSSFAPSSRTSAASLSSCGRGEGGSDGGGGVGVGDLASAPSLLCPDSASRLLRSSSCAFAVTQSNSNSSVVTRRAWLTSTVREGACIRGTGSRKGNRACNHAPMPPCNTKRRPLATPK
mmetsp:Transcript_116890/g.337805  ORF Transcript_116890/g.337805 Transcript_116890/m.337805 type:complete len:273 (+) Transcript_116890:493-1311(+)